MLNALLGLFRSAPDTRKQECAVVSRRFRPYLETLEDRTLLAAYVWTGDQGLANGNFNWSAPKNWDVNGQDAVVAPGKNDDVSFASPGLQNVTSVVDQVFEIKSLTSDWASTIKLDKNLTVNRKFQFKSGTFDGSGDLIMEGNGVWETGNMRGSGTLQVLKGFTILTPLNGTQEVELKRNLVIEEDGAFRMSRGNIKIGGDTVITNRGTFDIAGTTKIEKSGSGSGSFSNVDNGVVRILGDVTIGTKFNHTSAGKVVVRANRKLDLTFGGSSSGEYQVESLGTLTFRGSAEFEWKTGTLFRGEGKTILNGPTAVIRDGATITAENFRMEGNSTTLIGLGEPGKLTIKPGAALAEGFIWSGGRLRDIVVNVSRNAEMKIVTAPNTALSMFRATLLNEGRTFLGGTGSLEVTQSTIENSKSFSVYEDANLIATDVDSQFKNAVTGKFAKSGGTGQSTVDIFFQNQGKVLAASGKLKMPAITQDGVRSVSEIDGGKFDTDGQLMLESGILRNVGASALDGEIFGDVFNTGGTVHPGGRGETGVLKIYGLHGIYSQTEQGRLFVDLSNPTPGTGYDQLQVTGPLTLGGTLKVNPLAGFTGDSFCIVDNQGAGAVAGTFDGLAEGASLSIGGRQFQITYHGGDGNDVVLRSATTTSVSSSSPVTITNVPVLLTATVGSASGTPTGSVQFLVNGIAYGEPVALSGGSASIGLNGLPVGEYSVTAVYSGDGDFAASAGAAAQTVSPAPTEVRVTSLRNPAVFGDGGTLLALAFRATPPSGFFPIPPTGTITLYDTFEGQTTVLAVNVLGQPPQPLPELAVGTHTIVMVYSGDANFLGSVSAPLIQEILPPPENPEEPLTAEQQAVGLYFAQVS